MNKENDVQSPNVDTNTNQAPVENPENSAVTPTEQVQSTSETPVSSETPAPSSTEQAPAPAVTPPAPVEPHQPKVQDQVILNLKEDKGGNIIGVIAFFAIIFVVLFFLPKISDELSKYIPGISKISGPSGPISTSNDEEKKPEEKPDEKKDELYDLNGFVSNAGIDDLKLGNFVKDNNSGVNKLSYYVLNNGAEAFTFSDSTKFFIDLYENETYVGSVLVYSFKDIGPKESIDFSSILSNDIYKRANKFKIVRKNKSDYPAVKLNKQEGDYSILTCIYGNNTVEYYFKDNFLEMIMDNYTESKTSSTYDQDLEQYRSEANNYKDIESIDYNIIETAEGFNVKNKIELETINDADLKKLAIYKYFSYHKESKIVSFEMTSLGYTCS